MITPEQARKLKRGDTIWAVFLGCETAERIKVESVEGINIYTEAYTFKAGAQNSVGYATREEALAVLVKRRLLKDSQ